MNSATDTDSTTDTRLKLNDNCSRSKLHGCSTGDSDGYESWQEKEKKRLSNILDYNLENFDVEDKGLQAITKLASIICGTSMSFVTLVGTDYVRFLSRYGNPHLGTIRQNSFCTIAIEQNEFFEIEDSLKDPRFDENEFVKGQETPLRYYGGFPLVSPKGFKFGSLCVCDLEPKKLNEIQKEALKTLTEEVIVHLELRRHNKELKEANERAEKLAKVKNDFMNNVSHELRTPLNAISGYAEILYKTELDRDQKEAVGTIKSSCEILITLINDILDFSKIQVGKLQLENIPFDIRKTIKNVKDLLKFKAKEKNLRFDLVVDEKIPKFILGDKVRLNQIIMNLTGNALKFTQEGFVNIVVKNLEETENKIKISFSVKDSGIGIPEDKINTIFERFEQAGKDITRKFGGTGLGLNISKNLVELHQSTLEVRSVFGKGTEFFFIIYFDKFIEDNIDNINAANGNVVVNKSNNFIEKLSNLKNLQLLVCEDNCVNIKLIKAIFKNKFMNIEIAENGKIAIDILKRKQIKYDLILMDLQMPEMNGFETTKYIRNVMNLNIPIIGFSASTSEIEKNYCFEIGMNDYILKSFGGNEIFDKLTNFITTNKIYEEDIEDICKNNSKELKNNSFGVIKKKNPEIKKNKKKKDAFEKNKNIIKRNHLFKEKEKYHSICEKINKNHNNSENRCLVIKQSSNETKIHHSVYSQRIFYQNKLDSNYSSEKNENSLILINNKILNSHKNSNSSFYENSYKDIEESKINIQSSKKENNSGYNSNNEFYSINKKNINNNSFSNLIRKKGYSIEKIINRSLHNNYFYDHDEKEIKDRNVDFNKSFKSECNNYKLNIYLKKCLANSKKESSKNSPNIININSNIYKFSKFNENINTNNINIKNENNNMKNEILQDINSSNSSSMNILLEDENNNKKEILLEKEKKESNNNHKIDNNNKEEKILKCNNRISSPFKNNNNDNIIIGKKNNFEKKHSFSKNNSNSLKDNESLEFSQVSIKFENFEDNSENENEDLMNLENADIVDIFEEDLEMRNELLELFVEENPKQMKNLKNAIISKNLEAIKFVAHTMRPSILMFGLKKLYKKLEKIETICKSVKLSKINNLYDEIKTGLEIFFSENNKVSN